MDIIVLLIDFVALRTRRRDVIADPLRCRGARCRQAGELGLARVAVQPGVLADGLQDSTASVDESSFRRMMRHWILSGKPGQGSDAVWAAVGGLCGWLRRLWEFSFLEAHLCPVRGVELVACAFTITARVRQNIWRSPQARDARRTTAWPHQFSSVGALFCRKNHRR
jgi:hypothetical protein